MMVVWTTTIADVQDGDKLTRKWILFYKIIKLENLKLLMEPKWKGWPNKRDTDCYYNSLARLLMVAGSLLAE